MAANTSPIFSLTPNVGGVAITAALTKSDGTASAIGTDIFKAFTAGANGSWVSKVRITLCATTAGTATTATVARIYASSRTSGATVGGTDTFQIGEITLASQTADSTSAAAFPYDLSLNFALTAAWTILVSTHAAPASNTVIEAVVFGGDF